jgi:hypothetical protein
VKQKKSGSLARLRSIDRAVGEKSIHAVSLSGLRAACFGSVVRRRFQIDKSKFAVFKLLSLDVIFHGCETMVEIQGNCDAFAR